jgi:TonB family protein
MIAAWILHTLVVSLLAGAGALVLEALLRGHRRPTRWVWAGAMLLSAVWPLGKLLLERLPTRQMAAPVPEGVPVVFLDPLIMQVGPESVLRSLDGPLLLSWAVAAVVLLFLFSRVLIRTYRLRRVWNPEVVRGQSVLFSRDWGPGVVGFLRPAVVLPEWCRGLDDQSLRLILDHEMEHLRAGDLRLILAARILPILVPWNLPLWWQLSRLKMAVEGDCDLRVLGRHPGRARPYLELLLDVGRGVPGPRALAAMLSEPRETLERRIRIMTMPLPKKPWIRALILGSVGAVLVAVACWAPGPLGLDEVAAPQARDESVLLEQSQETSVAAGDILHVGVRPDGTVELRRGEATEVQMVRVDELGPIWRQERARNPNLVATVRVHANAESRLTAEVLEALSTGGPARIAVQTQEGPATDLSAEPTFTPFTVRPGIKNRQDISSAVEREYPPLLRDAGIGGAVQVWFFIDESGTVRRTQLNQSSGHQALDEAALRVAEVIQFTPALNRDQRVPVWISLPINFTTAQREIAIPPRAEEVAAGARPRPRAPADPADGPTFTPFTVRPDIKNRSEFQGALEREYPPLLRDAGIGGTVQVWFYIDETGSVGRTLVNRSSGHQALDEAALRVAEVIQFTPALNRDAPVPVWISLPVNFTTR